MSTKATHWSSYSDPEYWPDNPVATPRAAVEQMLANRDGDEGDELMHELRNGDQEVTLFGFIETDEIIPMGSWFDGYTTGDTYFKPTGEKVYVRVSLSFEVIP